MNKYFLRCVEADYPALVELGKLLGVLQEVPGGVTAASPGDCWRLLGPLPADQNALRLDAEGNPPKSWEPRRDPNGAVYIHANFLTSTNLREAAEALAAKRPEIAGALSEIGRYFIVDADGNATAPANPYEIFG